MSGGIAGWWIGAAGHGRKRSWLLATVIVVVITSLVFVGFAPFTTDTALASTTTLSLLGGDAEVRLAGAGAWQPARDGATLMAGDRVRTHSDGRALITFFEGSTIELEPNTDLTIRALEASADTQRRRRYCLLNGSARPGIA